MQHWGGGGGGRQQYARRIVTALPEEEMSIASLNIGLVSMMKRLRLFMPESTGRESCGRSLGSGYGGALVVVFCPAACDMKVMRCSAVITRSIFSHILTIDTP